MLQTAGLKLVAVVDPATAYAGKDLGSVLGLPRKLRITIEGRPERFLKKTRADVVFVCTSSLLRDVKPLLLQLVARRMHVITTCEELAYPIPARAAEMRELDRLARSKKVSLLATGINPGFAMDALPLALTGPCAKVRRVSVTRVVDAASRSLALQRRVGAGLNLAQFRRAVSEGAVRHVGLVQSAHMIASALGWKLARVDETLEPAIAPRDLDTEYLRIAAGASAGIRQSVRAYRDGELAVSLDLQVYVGAEAPRDHLLIDGDPPIDATITGGINGEMATAALLVNSLPRVLAAPPGLLTADGPAARARPEPAGPRGSASAEAVRRGAAAWTASSPKGIVPGLLRELYVGRRSGWLRLVRGKERQSIRFRRGHIVNAHTNVLEERLGELMVRRGKLSAADLARATEIVIREKARLGEVLTRLGLIDASGLEDAVAMHVHEMLVKVFTWTEGSYQFEPEEDDAPVDELTLKVSTGQLILDAVRALADPGLVREALGNMDRVLRPSDDPLLRFQKLSLSPADGFLLSRVDGTTSARQVVEMIPLPAEDTERSLLCLLATGAVEFVTPQHARPSSPGATVQGRPAPKAAPPPYFRSRVARYAPPSPSRKRSAKRPTARRMNTISGGPVPGPCQWSARCPGTVRPAAGGCSRTPPAGPAARRRSLPPRPRRPR